MRRMMQSLFVLAIFAPSALAQSGSPVVSAPCTSGCSNHGSGPIYPSAYGCGNGTGGQLAAYMNSFPTHPNLWDSYPAQYDAKLNCLFQHVDGCNCLDPKRNLHSHPSLICRKGGGACEGVPVQATERGFSKLYASPAAVSPNDSLVQRIWGAKPTLPPPPGAAPAAASPAATAPAATATAANAANAGIQVNAAKR